MILKSLAFLIFTATVAAAQCDAGEVSIRFEHDAPPVGHPKGEAAAFLAELVNNELDGRACMTVIAESETYSDATVLDGLASGQYQMAAPAMGNMGDISERFLIFDLPFLFRDLPVVLDYQDSPLGRGLLTEEVDKGLMGLAFWADGMKAMSAQAPIESPEDIAGMTFGTQHALIEADYFTELGAQTLEVPPTRLADALQSGEVDGQNSTWTDISVRGLAYSHDSITETNHGLVQYMLVTSPQFWDSLDAELRDDLNLLIEIVTLERNRFAYELANIAQQQARQDGLRIVRLDDNTRIEWVRAMQPTWFRHGGEIGFDQIAAVSYAAQTATSMFAR